MRAALHDPAAIDDEDLIGMLDGREPVRDDDNRLPPRELGEGLLYEGLVLRVDARRRLVEDHDRGVLEQRAGDGDALLLPSREGVSRLAHHGAVPLGELPHELVHARPTRRLGDLLARGAGAPEADVVLDGVVEEVDLLEYGREVPEQAVARQLAHVAPPDEDGALIDVPEAHHEVGDRRLPRTTRAHDGAGRLFGDDAGHVLQGLFAAFLVVGERDVPKLDAVVGKEGVAAVGVDGASLLDRLDAVHDVVQVAEHVRRVVHPLDPREHGERERAEGEQHPEIDASAGMPPHGGGHDPDARQLEGAKVDDVARREAELDRDARAFEPLDRGEDGLHRRASVAVGLRRPEPADVLDDVPGELLGRFVGRRGEPCGNPVRRREGEAGHRRPRNRRRTREGLEGEEEADDGGEVHVAVHDGVHHLHALELEHAELGRRRREDVARLDVGEIAERHALENVADLDAVVRGDLVADGFLKAVLPVREGEARGDAGQDGGKRPPDP